jgi:transcriptional regulator GlxA family with amidase domain
MQSSPKTTTIDFMVFDQFSNHCMANCLEPFRAANTLAARELYRWNIVTLDGQSVKSSSDLRLMPDQALNTTTRADFLFVIASYDFRQHDTVQTRRALRAAAGRYKTIVGLDAGPWLMASAGLLDQRKCTVHWDIYDEFAEEFPNVDVDRQRFIWDGTVATCGGAMAAFDLSLDLIRHQNGATLALDVASIFMSVTPHAPQGNVRSLCKIPIVQDAVALMQSNIEAPLTIPEIALQLGTNAKQLLRAFIRDLNQSPIDIYRNLRLSFARHLLHTTDHSIHEALLRAGYQNQSAFSRAFKARFGQTPQNYRNSSNTKHSFSGQSDRKM